MPKTIAVIDGNSLMHRAYHAVPPTMSAPDGTPTNAVFGFMQMLIAFIEKDAIAEMREAGEFAIVCAFDRGKPKFRMEALEQYKAQRPPMDAELRAQFPIVEELLAALDIPVVAKEGWEGDDILGTIAARDEALGISTLLVTGDKDAYQLASELTHIVTTKKGITDVVVYGPAEVEERYGVRPDQFIDFLGLKGDKADNIPGVPGIGDKKAASMLQAYGHLEGIYENLSSFKGKQLENLTNYKDDAFLSRQVATIVCDAPVAEDVDLQALSFPSFDAAVVTEVFGKYRMRTQLARVLSFADGSAAHNEITGFEPILYGTEAAAAVASLVEQGAELSVAWGHEAQATLFGSDLSLAVKLEEGTALLSGEEALNALAGIVGHAHFTTYDAKRLIEQVLPHDSSVPARIEPARALNARFFDVALAAYVVDSDAGDVGVCGLAERYLGVAMPEGDDAQVALAREAAALAQLRPALEKALEEAGAAKVYETIDAPLVGVLACMERVGACIDVARLAELAESTGVELDALRDRIIELAGEEFNIDSPKQLSHILFDVLGLTPTKKTRTGYSTDAKVLKELSLVHELPAQVLSYREFAKIKSTYIDALPRMRAGDGRVHTSFNQRVTTTGRLSSSDPNLQNIPVRTDFGRKIRECFVPLEKGQVFLSADYSQIELRVLAHLSGDEHLIEAFNFGADFHASTAARVFGVPIEEVTPTMRSRAKAVNFGIVYGQQAYGLSQSLGIPFGEAKGMIDRYFEAHPGVRRYLDEVVRSARETGYAETLFGRRRHIPELSSRNPARRGFGERTAMNHPMQGTAADIIKMAMRQVADELAARKLGTQLLIQVHDELDFSVPETEVEEVSAFVRDIMENIVQLSVPLVVDMQQGSNWAQAH